MDNVSPATIKPLHPIDRYRAIYGITKREFLKKTSAPRRYECVEFQRVRGPWLLKAAELFRISPERLYAEVAAWVEGVPFVAPVEKTKPLAPERTAGQTKRATLYRFFDRRGFLLYIGITTSGMSRFRHHEAERLWWPDVAWSTFEHFDSSAAARAAERDAIAQERPRFNYHHNLMTSSSLSS